MNNNTVLISINAVWLSNVSYLIFTILGLISCYVLYRLYKNSTIDITKLDKLVEFFKSIVYTTCVGFVALSVLNINKERETDFNEMKTFKEYADKIVTMELKDRVRYSKFISIMCPKGDLQTSWKEYYEFSKDEMDSLKQMQTKLNDDSTELNKLKSKPDLNNEAIKNLQEKINTTAQCVEFVRSAIIVKDTLK